MKFVFDDGGRQESGRKGFTGDCVVRSISISTGQPYSQVYDDLFEFQKNYSKTRRDKTARSLQKRGSSPRLGVHKKVIREYMEKIGWEWVPTMKIGSGCSVHLREDELPGGRLIVSVSRHMCSVIDGVLRDNHDSSRGGNRCVYGYFMKKNG